ncbi:MAG TPA: hypothetical protein VMS60_16045 [Solirubrobacterales bacterium]|nr:hypothetical protein [Solirubrobacterales bacterium]
MNAFAAPPDGLLEEVVDPDVLTRARQLGDAEDPPSLALLVACVELAPADGLGELLETMLLDPRALRLLYSELSELEDLPASTAVRRARSRTDLELGLDDLVIGVALLASPRTVAALRRRGLGPPELAAQVAEWRLRAEGLDGPRSRVAATSTAAFTFTLATTLLLGLHVFGGGSWWQLALVVPIWWGYPREGPLVGCGVALLLAWLTAPAIGAVAAAGVLVEVAEADAERLATWAETGIRLRIREQRHVRQRLLSASGRRLRRLRQTAVVQLRGLRRVSKPA